MERPQFFKDLDRSLAGEDVAPVEDTEPDKIRVSCITRHYQDPRAADAEAARIATYAAMMQQQASVRVSLEMACLTSNAAPAMDFYPQYWRNR